MSKFKHDLILQAVNYINVVVMTAVFGLIWMQFYAPYFRVHFYRRGHILVFVLFFFLYYSFGQTYEAFQISIHRISELVYSQTLALALTDIAMMIVVWLLLRHFPTLLPALLMFALQFAWSIAWAYLAHKLYFKLFSAKKTIIIYDMREGMEELISEYGMEVKFSIGEIIQVKEALKKVPELLEGYEAVYLCGIHSHDRNIFLKLCIPRNISVFVIPRIGDTLMTGAKRAHMYHLPVLRVEGYNPKPEYLIIKRFFDIVISGLALIILSPVMLVTAILIKRDGGPAFYKQVRLTQHGREFQILKFRSMRVDAEKDGVARLSTGEDDDRITPVGRVIRLIRLDEIPQLINVFKGDMSIVGPRPERPEIAAQYEESLPEFGLRLQAKAGLTGYAQIHGKYNTIPYDKLMMDLMYIAHPSLVEDLRIILATIKILFMPESTEGVGAGQVTAMEETGPVPAVDGGHQTKANTECKDWKE